jgi:hypothetical protein
VTASASQFARPELEARYGEHRTEDLGPILCTTVPARSDPREMHGASLAGDRGPLPRLASIGYANKPGKDVLLAGAGALVEDMNDIATALDKLAGDAARTMRMLPGCSGSTPLALD